MRAYNLERFIISIERWGIADVLLPFLLLFAIFYGILTKAKVLGEHKGINLTTAAVISATPVVFHAVGAFPERFDPVIIINQAVPGISLVAVAMISLLIFFGLFGGKPDFNYSSISAFSFGIILLFIINTVLKRNTELAFIISMIIILLIIFSMFKTGLPGLYDLVVVFSTCFIIYIFGRKVGWFDEPPSWLMNDYFIGLGITIIIFFIIIAVAVKGDKNEPSK